MVSMTQRECIKIWQNSSLLHFFYTFTNYIPFSLDRFAITVHDIIQVDLLVSYFSLWKKTTFLQTCKLLMFDVLSFDQSKFSLIFLLYKWNWNWNRSLLNVMVSKNGFKETDFFCYRYLSLNNWSDIPRYMDTQYDGK